MTGNRNPTGAATRTGLVAVVVGAALSTAAGANPDVPQGPEENPEPTDEQISNSITVYDLSDSVSPLETVEEDAESTIISLATDVLFEPESWEVPEGAEDAFTEIFNEVPEGAEVEVIGHTDSRPSRIGNDQLSENRAQAVADLLEDERGDLEISSEGVADSDPATTEDDEDPSTFADNRRVEISYTAE